MAYNLDSSLIKAAAQGDRLAMTRLLQTIQGPVFNTCLRMLSHPQDAEEVAQETLLRVVEHLKEFEGRSDLSTWVTRIAMNQSLTRLRQRKLRKTASLDAESGGSEDGPTLGQSLSDERELTGDCNVELAEDLTLLQEGIKALDEEFRGVIVLRDLQEMDYAQIAQVLNVPVGTVKSRLFRARAALRAWMEARQSMARVRRG
jgi:RNA polymerase sigma-70 factor, ECF subfamily